MRLPFSYQFSALLSLHNRFSASLSSSICTSRNSIFFGTVVIISCLLRLQALNINPKSNNQVKARSFPCIFVSPRIIFLESLRCFLSALSSEVLETLNPQIKLQFSIRSFNSQALKIKRHCLKIDFKPVLPARSETLFFSFVQTVQIDAW